MVLHLSCFRKQKFCYRNLYFKNIAARNNIVIMQTRKFNLNLNYSTSVIHNFETLFTRFFIFFASLPLFELDRIKTKWIDLK